MLYRYGVDPDTGKKKKTAVIYTRDEHGIDNNKITREVFKVIRKLKDAGFESYIVGGAVRDLMLGRRPKDFDIATDAEPQRIRRLFANSRVIGKRFKLCHVYFGSTILEVCTFRSKDSDNFVNSYGDIAEDAHRRDFSINALYYCPLREWLFDYVDGFEDVKKKRIRSLIDLNETFKQDPVRMIRAIKYSQSTGCQMNSELRKAIRRDFILIKETPVSRMVEEVFKILQGGNSTAIFQTLKKYGLFPYLLEGVNEAVNQKGRGGWKVLLSQTSILDKKIAVNPSLSRDIQIYYLVKCFMNPNINLDTKDEIFKGCFKDIKKILFPLTPPNVDVEKACLLILKDHGLTGFARRDPRRGRRVRKSTYQRKKRTKPEVK